MGRCLRFLVGRCLRFLVNGFEKNCVRMYEVAINCGFLARFVWIFRWLFHEYFPFVCERWLGLPANAHLKN